MSLLSFMKKLYICFAIALVTDLYAVDSFLIYKNEGTFYLIDSEKEHSSIDKPKKYDQLSLLFWKTFEIKKAKFKDEIKVEDKDGCGEKRTKTVWRYVSEPVKNHENQFLAIASSDIKLNKFDRSKFKSRTLSKLEEDTIRKKYLSYTGYGIDLDENIKSINKCKVSYWDDYKEIVCPFDSYFFVKDKLLYNYDAENGSSNHIEILGILKVEKDEYYIISNGRYFFETIPKEGSNHMREFSSDLGWSC